MKIPSFLINSNIYIALGAVLLTVSAQIQLGMKPQLQPYLFLIFLATLLEYNLHRFITIITSKEALNSEKHRWVIENLRNFYFLLAISIIGFLVALCFTTKETLMVLAPMAFVTLFYSIPVSGTKNHLRRLRDIPYLKIFLIAAVWSGATILLPVFQANEPLNQLDVAALITERFLFIFAITLPFDIRDIKADLQQGLKTIPMLTTEKNVLSLSYGALFFSMLISVFHYQQKENWHIVLALVVSMLSTFYVLKSEKMKRMIYYHYGILDGTILLQGILVILAYSLL